MKNEHLQAPDCAVKNRQTVVETMYAMSQVQWMASAPSLLKESDCLLDIRTDRVYTGFAYSHALGSMENLQANTVCMLGAVHKLSGKYALFLEGTSASSQPNTPDYALTAGHILGADCSSSIAAAWRTVAPDATFARTSSLVPTPAHCTEHGLKSLAALCFPNDYYTSWDLRVEQNLLCAPSERSYQFRSLVSKDDGTADAQKLTALYEGYAKCQPGDAIVFYAQGYVSKTGAMRLRAGHARLVAQKAHVVRDLEGNIDPQESFLMTIEQGKGKLNEENPHNSEQYSTWGVYCKYTFQTLAGIELSGGGKQFYAVYVPVTCPEFEKPVQSQLHFRLPDNAAPYCGVVSCNFGIVYTRLTIDGITDQQFTGQYGRAVGTDGKTFARFDGVDECGTTPYEALRALDTGTYFANRLLYKSVNLAKHAPAFEMLPSGEHSYTLEVKLTTGETKVFHGSFRK